MLVLLVLFLACQPDPKTGALNSVRGVPEQLQASDADGAGFDWSGSLAFSKVGCDVWHEKGLRCARSVLRGIWARNLLVARRAEAGS